jgi:hypothetical protein
MTTANEALGMLPPAELSPVSSDRPTAPASSRPYDGYQIPEGICLYQALKHLPLAKVLELAALRS